MGLFDKLKKMDQNRKDYFNNLSEKTLGKCDKAQAKIDEKRTKIKEKSKANFYKALDAVLESETPDKFLSKINNTISVGKITKDYKPVTMNYLDGYYRFKKSQKNIKVTLCEKGLIINAGTGDFIDINSIESIELLTEKEIEEKFTMKGLSLLEAYALDMPKKMRCAKQYIVINIVDDDIQTQLIFEGNKINDSYIELIDKFTNFKKENIEQTQNI